MRELLRTIREYNCTLKVYPRLTRDGVLYKLSVRLYGDVAEICSAIAHNADEFEEAAHHMLISFHKRMEEMELYPVE